jgi:hypothetical protein
MSSQYIIPSKQLHSQHDLDAKWINSEAYKKLLTFVGLLNDSCVGATWNSSSDIPQVYECPLPTTLTCAIYGLPKTMDHSNDRVFGRFYRCWTPWMRGLQSTRRPNRAAASAIKHTEIGGRAWIRYVCNDMLFLFSKFAIACVACYQLPNTFLVGLLS